MSIRIISAFVLTLFLVVAAPTWLHGQGEEATSGRNVLVYSEDVDALVGKETVEILRQYYSEEQIGVGEEFYETSYLNGSVVLARYVTYSFPHDPDVEAEIRRKLDIARGISPLSE